MGLYRFFSCSDHWVARSARDLYWGTRRFTLPAPRLVVLPFLWVYVAVRSTAFFLKRVLVCEPLFKAYCRQYGRRVRTGVYVPWVRGKGDIILGDDVQLDGRCAIVFAARYAERPALRVGSHTQIGNNCSFTIGKEIRVGANCHIASDVIFYDSSGHPSDPGARLAGLKLSPEEVRPVAVADNVWIGRRCIVSPGVTIGEGSIVSAGAVVMSDVPPYTVVGGNPARKIAALKAPADGAVPVPV